MTTTTSAFASVCTSAAAARSALDRLASSLSLLAETCTAEAAAVAGVLDALPAGADGTATGSAAADAFNVYQQALTEARQGLVNQVGSLGETAAFARQEAGVLRRIGQALPCPSFASAAEIPAPEQTAEPAPAEAPERPQDATDAPAEPTPVAPVVPAPEATEEAAGQPAAEEVVQTAANGTAAPAEPPALEPVPEVPAPTEVVVEPAGQEQAEEVLTLAQAQRMRKADLRELAQRRGCDVGDDDTKGAILDALTAAGIVS